MAKTLIGTATTDANGVATITYEATGAGDVTIVAESDTLSSEPYDIKDAIYYNPTPFTTETILNIPNLPSDFQASFICNTSSYAWFGFGADQKNRITCGVTDSVGKQMGLSIRHNGSYVISDSRNVLSPGTDVELIYSVKNGMHTLSYGTHTISFNNSDITERNYSYVYIRSGYLKELLIMPL